MEAHQDQPTDRFPKIKKTKEQPENNTEATPEMSAAQSNSPDQIKSWLRDAMLFMDNKKYHEAIYLFEKILQIDPDNLTAYEKLSVARSAQADLASAEDYLAMGKQCVKDGDLRGAYEELQTVLNIIPDHHEARHMLQNIESQLGIDPSKSFFTPDSQGNEKPEIQEREVEIELDSSESNREDARKFVESATAEWTGSEIPEMIVSSSADSISEERKEIERAIELYEAQELDKSLQILKKLDGVYPNHSQIRYYIDIIQRQLQGDKTSKNQENAERLFKEGMEELDNGNTASAASKFEEALELKPDFQQARLMLGKINDLRTSRPKSKSDTEKPISAPQPKPLVKPKPVYHKSWPIARYVFVSIAILVVIALAYFFFIKYPEIQIANHLKNAKQKFTEKDFPVVFQELDAVHRLDASNLEAWEMEGSTQLEMGKGDAAAIAFSKALEINPLKINNILSLGQAYYIQKKYDLAENQFRKVALDKSYEIDGYYRLGLCLTKQGKKTDAEDAFKKVIEKNPSFAPAYLELGKILENKETPELAETQYLLALEKDSKFTEAYENLGRYYLELQKFDQAVEILNQPLLWLKPSNQDQAKIVAKLRLLLGKAYFEKGDYEKSVENLNRILPMHEYEEEAYIEVGRAYYRLNRDQQAIIAWQKALEINPNNADLYFYLGSTYHRIGEFKKELTAYQDAIKIDPNHARAYANMGFFYFNDFKYSLAKEAWKKSLSIDPNQPHIIKKLQEIENLGIK